MNRYLLGLVVRWALIIGAGAILLHASKAKADGVLGVALLNSTAARGVSARGYLGVNEHVMGPMGFQLWAQHEEGTLGASSYLRFGPTFGLGDFRLGAHYEAIRWAPALILPTGATDSRFGLSLEYKLW